MSSISLLIKEKFSSLLSSNLKLTKVYAPLIIEKDNGEQDLLSGIETPIQFSSNNKEYEIVQSLAKWKRAYLSTNKYNGIITDMRAIRKDEHIDSLHAITVDQFDWEMRMSPDDRNLIYLSTIVNSIYSSIKDLQSYVQTTFSKSFTILPDNIKFMSSSDVISLKKHNQTNDSIINDLTKEYKALCITKIGSPLANNYNMPFDTRSPDYDDWDLNCDIFLWSTPLQKAIEISSMGIRVNKISLQLQCNQSNNSSLLLSQPWHKKLLNNELPQTIGGGIGIQRLLMFMLDLDSVHKVYDY